MRHGIGGLPSPRLTIPPTPRILATLAVALAVANCSSQQNVATQGRAIDPKYGVAASPRVVEEGQPIPKGGGREMVGRAYQVAGRTYVPRDNPRYSGVGLASWYGSAFHGRLTANGEIFDRHSIAAAHTTMALPSYARVTNLQNNRSMIVRVNDRGPYHAGRILDVSEGVAEALEFRRTGTARVRVDYVGRASTRGSDDRKLLATLRTDGAPAAFPGAGATMIASAEPSPARHAFAFLGVAEPQGDAWPSAAPASSERRVETAATPAPVRVSAPVPFEVASALPRTGQVVTDVPLPPERPFDLGPTPTAATPTAKARVAQVPPPRPVVASLFYAPREAPGHRFEHDDPFKQLKAQRFVALKTAGQDSTHQR